MLISLRFQNIALFGDLEIDFQKGFTAFTGQTGSGKSIFFDTLNALLAKKNNLFDNRLIANGSSFSSIEGVFTISNFLKDWLINQELDNEDDLIITREWRLKDNKYKSRFRVNGVLVNRDQILYLRKILLDFTLQGEAHILNDPLKQLYLLDNLLISKNKDLISRVRKQWKIWSDCNSKLKEVKDKKNILEQEFQNMQYIYDDLEKLELEDATEDIKLEIDQNRLANILRLQEGIKSILIHLIDSRDEFPTLVDHADFCITQLKALTKLDSSLQSLSDNFSTIINNIYDLIYQIKDYEKTLDTEPSSLNDLQVRLSVLKRYQQKYQKSLPELIEYKNQVCNYLASQSVSNNIDEYIALEKKQRISRDNLNQELSDLRKITALEFEHKLILSLKELGIPNVRFKVVFEECDANDSGKDRVIFLFSANPGIPLCNLSEIASGGEKSRLLLAIKAIFSSFDQKNLLVFDEIDSGVSGSVSTYVAKLLSKLSLKRQVFCVTHQPLIAAFADNHFAFQKQVIEGKTLSRVFHLKEKAARQKELACLAGGEVVEANAYAASLLEHKAA
tara:strand:- start:14000 stop:15685 length:1686 start_codon:yes stop_codon:yes gene_type:complete